MFIYFDFDSDLGTTVMYQRTRNMKFSRKREKKHVYILNNIKCLCINDFKHINQTLKQSLYRPGQTVSIPGVSGSWISRQSAHESSNDVKAMHRPPLPLGNIPGTHFC